MAKEEIKGTQEKEKTSSAPAKVEAKEDRVIRILSTDVEGRSSIYSGLTRVKGISWALSKAICKKLGFDQRKKIGSLTEKELEKVLEFAKNADVPEYLKNRQKDFDTGENKHLIGGDLDLKKDFDIKRLKKVKTYRGLRHGAGLPTKGQRTRSNFRMNRSKGAGIKKKKDTVKKEAYVK
jgi:small subunit ribosomal protein S13